MAAAGSNGGSCSSRKGRELLHGCIGCGCLSLDRCGVHNPGDRAADLGTGPFYLLGDRPARGG